MTDEVMQKEVRITNPPQMSFYGSESINSICTNIEFSGNNLKTILITSCIAGEGKSTMASRIVMSMASRGKKTVLVDLDLRKSVTAGRLGLESDGKMYGIAHYLVGQKTYEDVVYKSDIKNLYIVPVGRDVSSPTTLINSAAFAEFFEQLKKDFEMIIVDTPPIGVVIDAADISKVCDGGVIVIEYGKRHRHEVVQSVEQMKRSNTPILGCIIDKVTVKSLSEKKYYKSHYGYYGKYGYYNREDN